MRVLLRQPAVPAPRQMEIALGIVLVLTGLVIAVRLSIDIGLYAGLDIPGRVALSASLFLVALCFHLSYRLLNQRPPTCGRLLSPVGWRMLGIGFVMLSAFWFQVILGQQAWLAAPGPLLALGLALSCFYTAGLRFARAELVPKRRSVP